MPLLLSIILYVIIAFLITQSRDVVKMRGQRKLWLITYTIYFIYTLVAQSYVSDPSSSYFVNSDQMTFYNRAIELSGKTVGQIFKTTFTEFRYSESPLAFFLFALLAKIGNALRSSNIFLFMLSHVTFLASLIPVYIYKIVYDKQFGLKNLERDILVFALISPLILYSAQLMRDVHVCFIYTLMTFIAINKEQRFRYLWLTLLLVISYFFRVESGLFAFAFIAIPLYKSYREGNALIRFSIILIFILFCVIAIGSIFNVAFNTISHYNIRSINAASETSLGNKLNDLPFPLDVLSKTAFGQILPFPIWFPFKDSNSYDYLRLVECIWPFYWITVWFCLIYAWIKFHKLWDKDLLTILYISILYLLLCSAGEFNTRRLMAVYPILLACFLILKQKFDVKESKYAFFSFVLLFTLHIIYIILK